MPLLKQIVNMSKKNKKLAKKQNILAASFKFGNIDMEQLLLGWALTNKKLSVFFGIQEI